MNFLQEFQASLRAGLSGIILSGATRDYFPIDADSNLHPLNYVLMEGLKGEYFPISYSPSLGFETLLSYADDLKKYLGLGGESSNPIEKSANAMVSLDSYEPYDAVKIIRLASLKEQGKKLLIIINDIDTFCAREDGVNGNVNTKSIPSLLLSLVCHPTFIQSGHALALITNSVSGLNERLTSIDSPFRVVSVLRPSDEERESFLKTRVVDITTKKESEEVENVRCRIAEIGEEFKILEKEQGVLCGLVSENRKSELDFDRKIKDLNTEKIKLLQTKKEEDQIVNARPGCKLVFDNAHEFYVHKKVVLADGLIGLELLNSNKELIQMSGAIGVVYKTKNNNLIYASYFRSGLKLASDWQPYVSFGDITQSDIEENVTDEVKEKLLKIGQDIESLRDKMLAAQKIVTEKNNEFTINKRKILELQSEYGKLTALIEKDSNSFKDITKIDFEVSTLVKITKGLSYLNMMQLLRSSKLENTLLTESIVMEKRKEIYVSSYGHLFRIVEPLYGFDGVAGLSHAKEYFAKVVDRMRRQDYRNVPMGCMLMGPPGTGKSAIAEAAALETAIPFVEMKQIRDQFVGQSERKLEEALNALRTLAPVIVYKDEIDEEDSGRDSYQGDSGVSGRMRQMWMTFLSDPKIRGKVFLAAPTNRPDRVDPALLRSGRMDDRIPILMPDQETRIELFKVMLKRSNYMSDINDFLPFAEATEDLNGADIEVIVRRAYDFSIDSGKEFIDSKSLMDAINDFIPSYEKVKIANMTMLAINYASSKKYLPKNADEIREKCEKILSRNNHGIKI